MIPIQKLNDQAIIPKYQSELASGFDLHACLTETITILPGQRAIIPTGIAFALPDHLEIQIRPRSGLAAKHGITVLNTPGTIDADYRGEIKVILYNTSDQDFVIQHGDRIAQGVLQVVIRETFVEVETLDQTDRGSGGFGHTGK